MVKSEYREYVKKGKFVEIEKVSTPMGSYYNVRTKPKVPFPLGPGIGDTIAGELTKNQATKIFSKSEKYYAKLKKR